MRQRQPQRDMEEPTGPGASPVWEQLGNKEGVGSNVLSARFYFIFF